VGQGRRVRRPHPLDLLGTQALEVVKEDAAHFLERLLKSPVFLGTCGFKREPVALHLTQHHKSMLYIVHDDRVIDSFLESDMDHAKNAMRFVVLKEWFDKNDYTKSENIWLTRFPAGSLASDTLHTVL
jgi:hypothetical protein